MSMQQPAQALTSTALFKWSNAEIVDGVSVETDTYEESTQKH